MPFSLDSTISLANGVPMPLVGLGTYKSAEGGAVERAVSSALEIGYRGIDTASMYGNEEGIGRAVRASGIPRESLFVATKVWNDEQGYRPTLAACERSLRRLGMDYVDLYLIHWPVAHLMADTWRAMQELLGQERVRAIGVCNFLVHHLRNLERLADVPPMVDQIEHHPRLQQPDLLDYCVQSGIVVEAWAPLMRGRVLEIPELVRIGERHAKDAVQVTLRWMLQRGVVTIPKSVHPKRIRANADIFDFELYTDEMAVIDALDSGERIGPHPDDFAS